MAQRTIGHIVALVDANVSPFIQGMDRAQNSVQRLERNISGQFAKISRTIASFNVLIGAAAVGAVTRLVSSFTNVADETGKFADRIGVAVEDLSRLQYAAELSGVSVDTLNSSLQRQSRRIAEAADGNTRYTEALESIGLNVQEILNLSPDQAFLEIAGAMEEVDNQARKVALAQSIWGREGVALLQLTDQGAESIMAMADEADRLGVTLSSGAAQSSAQFNDAITRLQSSLRGLGNVLIPLILPALEALINYFTWTIQWAVRVGRAIDQYLISPFQRLIRRLNILQFFGLLEDSVADTGVAVKELGDKQDEYNRIAEQTSNIADNVGTSVSQVEEEFSGLTIAIDTSETSLERYQRRLNDQLEVYDQTQEKIQALVEWFANLTPEDAAQNLEFFTDEMERLGRVVGEVTEQTEQTVNDLGETLEESFGDFAEEFGNALGTMVTDSDRAFEEIKRIVIRAISDIIAEILTNKISDAIGESIGRSAGQLAGQTGGAAGTGTALGGVLGTLLGSAAPILGGLAGAAAGGLLGSLFGGGNRIKESQLLIGSLGGQLNRPATASVESPFGVFSTFAFSRIGGEGQLSNEQALQILDTLESVGELISGIDEIIAGSLSQASLDRIAADLQNATGGARNYTPELINQFIRERFEIVFGEVDEALGQIFEEFAAGLEGDALLQFASDIALLNAAIEQGNAVFSDVATTAETVNILMRDFAASGEGLLSVLERLNEANSALAALGLPGDTTTGARFNLSILESFGNDAGRLNALVDTFFNTFFSETENLEREIARLGGLVPDILSNLGTTREEFAGDFLSSLQEGLLTPEEVGVWLEAGEALSLLIDLEERLNQIRADEAQTTRDALLATSAAIDEQIAAQQALRASIESVSAAIASSFGQTIERIQMSLLDQEGQYDFLSEIISGLVAQIETAASPEQLQGILDQINQRVNQAYGLLDESQQQAVGPDFINFLQETLSLGQERLTELNEEATQAQRELEERQAEIQRQLADDLFEAAAVQMQAGVQFDSAVTRFASATAQPLNVVVSIDQEQVGA